MALHTLSLLLLLGAVLVSCATVVADRVSVLVARWRQVPERSLIGGAHVSVTRVPVGSRSLFAHVPLRDVPLPPGAAIALVRRATHTFVPAAETVLLPADVLLVVDTTEATHHLQPLYPVDEEPSERGRPGPDPARPPPTPSTPPRTRETYLEELKCSRWSQLGSSLPPSS